MATTAAAAVTVAVVATTTRTDHRLPATLDKRIRQGLPSTVEPIRFAGEIRYWNPEKQGGLAVIDIPAEHVPAIGGLKQQRVHGTINGGQYSSNVMPAGGGRLALSVSKAMMGEARAAIGDVVVIEIARVGQD
jgi:hypothetical protein